MTSPPPLVPQQDAAADPAAQSDQEGPTAMSATLADAERGPSPSRRRRSRRRPARGGGPAPRPAQEPWEPWELPSILLVVALSVLLYGWGMGHAPLHPYYTAAVRSMASSWHAFFYGGLDPSASITIDKLPGAFWPQALAVRIFGPHNWAAALPQVLAGGLTVWLTHRYVRAWAGPVAAIIAALVLTLTPVTIVLNRHNIPDTLLTLLLVLAAGSAQRALREDRMRPLLLCGVWVGLAFQAKMLQAWLVLPVFAAVYLYAGPGNPARRALRSVGAGVAALVVSCFWILLVWATPAGSRPWLDGTTNNNPFTLVFGYNGVSRFGSDPTALGAVAGTTASRTSGNTGLTMLINTVVGPQISWFLPLALLALVMAVVWGRGEERTETLRSGFLLWGGWLLIHALVFSVSNGNHGYYTVILGPAVAALAGGGLALFWNEFRWGESQDRRWGLPVALGGTVLWAVYLESPHTSFASWQLTIGLLLGFCGVLGLASRGQRTTPERVRQAFAAGVAATLVAPAVWGISSLNPLYAGSPMTPLAGPVGSAYVSLIHHDSSVSTISMNNPTTRDRAVLGYLTAHRNGEKYLVATQAAYSAEPLLRDTSQPMLVMGGFTGLTPFPSAGQLASLVAGKQLRYALLTRLRPATPATRWVEAHCDVIPPAAYGRTRGGNFTLYDCRAGAASTAPSTASGGQTPGANKPKA